MTSDVVYKVNTPAFVFCAAQINAAVQMLRTALGNRDVRVLYSIKACGAEPVLEIIHPLVDGFSVSSPAEVRVALQFGGDSKCLQITSPGLRREWLLELVGISHIVFNSISQWQRLRGEIPSSVSNAIRVNPGRSNVDDERYDPCRKYSKLGVPIATLIGSLSRSEIRKLEGIHVHNSCLGESWVPMLETVSEISARLDPLIGTMKWINLGGGYVWDETTDFDPLCEAVDVLSKRYGLEVFIEPGAGIVNSAGFLVASVIDLFKNDGKSIAILDTTVNHLPEVFEYQFEPDVAEHVDGGRHEYILAGCSCLAGDLFGEYAFDEPLEIGSRITFENVGAYTIVKANMFNGINLPSVYTLGQTGEFELIKQFSLEDFVSRFGSGLNEYANANS